ncbi:uncharacterized protein LOC127732428 [Mytilus californianus]|uniref:uncharacterized protein LOC127732428 n=1 Tax=Mytilus californianus TaxID=6549 RepID=UPI002245A18F|nr:uncharacterized protein LOC127732428 [Mytilus californianus]
MATNTNICGICSLRQITKRSNHWCPDCEEAICDECKEHHELLKATRTHEPIPISNYRSLPAFITDIQQSCVYHNEKYLQYCVEHVLPICFKCITDHQKCTVIPLEDVTNNARTSEQFQDLEIRLEDLMKNIDRIKKDRKANVASIQEMKKKHVAEIRQIRIQINKHLDKLEKQIIKDIEDKGSQCKKNIEKILSSVTEKETRITECQANVKSIKQYASDLQTFLGMREIEEKVFENEQYLQSLIDAKSFDQLYLFCNVDTGVNSILNSLKNFGSIEIEKRASNIGFSRMKDNQAQLQVVTASKSIENVKLILQKKVTTRENIRIRGCSMSLNGDFFFTEHVCHKRLIVISSDGNLKYNMSLKPSHGFDLTFTDETTVAITSGYSQNETGINMIDIENQSKIKFIKLPSYPYGIARDSDSLFVCVLGHGIYKVNTLDDTTSLVISCYLPPYSYVSVFTDNIYFTDGDSVVCCDLNGTRVWTFKDDSILNCPTGITVDNDGNVYVVGERSSNVVIIANDRKHHKEILTTKDGLCQPSAIFFDKLKRKLLVANINNTAFLYSVT